MKYLSCFVFLIVLQIQNQSLAIADGVATASSISPSTERKEDMTFAVYPASPPIRMQKLYADLMLLLSKKLGIDAYFKTRSSHIDYLKAVEKEEFDIAVVNAFSYVKLKNKTQYIPVLMRSDELVATFVTNDKNINSIKDLRGKKIGYASEFTGASISAHYMLIKNGLLSSDYSSVFYNDHVSCLQAVINKYVDACATGVLIYQKLSPVKKSNLKVFAKGDPVPQMVILVHPRLKSHLVDIKKIFLDLDKTKSGRKILDETYLVALKEFSDEKYQICSMILDYISLHDVDH